MGKIMKRTGLGEVIILKMDFTDLQRQVIEVACLVLAKKEINAEDIQIIENSLGLWAASLIKNDTLVDEFYNYRRNEAD